MALSINVRNLASSLFAKTWLVMVVRLWDRTVVSGRAILQSTQRLCQRIQSRNNFTADAASFAGKPAVNRSQSWRMGESNFRIAAPIRTASLH